MSSGLPTAGHENPYRAQHDLDPRVDGGRAGDTSRSTHHHDSGLSSGRNETLGSGIDTLGGRNDTLGARSDTVGGRSDILGGTSGNLGQSLTGTHAHDTSRDYQPSGQGSSTLADTSTTGNTTGYQSHTGLAGTADPSDRSATYGGAPATQTSGYTGTGLTGTDSQHEGSQQPQGLVGKVLGAVGLGSALGYGQQESEGVNEPRDTTTTQSGSGVSRETGPPQHYRRESIPTTAYPGPNSAQPISAPVGGTRSSFGQAVGDPEAGVPRSTVHDLITTDVGATGSSLTTGGTGITGTGMGSHSTHDHSRHGIVGSTTGTHQSSFSPSGTHDTSLTSSTGTYNAPSTQSHTGSLGTTSTSRPNQTYTITSGVGTQPSTTSDIGTRDSTRHHQPHTSALGTTLPDRSRETPIDAVAAAPGRLHGQDAQPTHSSPLTGHNDRNDQTTRNTALGAGAGAATAAGVGHALHDRDRHDTTGERKYPAYEPLMPLNQSHGNDAERRERARLADEEENRRRREREAAAGVGTAAFTGAGASAHEKHHHSTEPEAAHQRHHHQSEQESGHQEKKPSIFKRIFKRRKNEHTGEDEEYSTDDEEDKAAHASRGGHHVPQHHSSTKDRNVLGSAATGTATHESRDSVTDLPYDPAKDPEAARRLSREPGYDTSLGRGTDAAPLGHSEVGGNTMGGYGTGTGVGAGTGLGTGAGTGVGTGVGSGHHIPTPAEVGNLGEVTDHRR
ncbi:hypothetical protein LTR51_004700 [Lithohypha guttulata]|nr:hypothetical protein LTR51_004700 [Lithohypha guttulata]